MIRTIQAEYPAASIRSLCQLLGISRSWFYAAPHPPRPDPDEMRLLQAIEAIVLTHPGYGYRRVTAALRRQGHVINHKRVLRLMRAASLLCQIKRSVHTTQSRHPFRRFPNRLRETVVTGPDQVWVADLTYLHFPRATGYLAVILDAWSRTCIGWALGDRFTEPLTAQALAQAVTTRQPAPGLIHHSDQGVQYANHAYLARLQQIGAIVSMSAIGRPTENALVEAFFSTLKREEVWLNDYQDLADARQHLTRFIDEVYNTTRLHSSLGYRPPAEYEQVAA
jgi:transposase InsO family protein